MTLQYGVVGWPVEHSLSPAMHNAAFAELAIDAEYKLLPIAPEEAIFRMRQLPSQGLSGWNVTVPHKAAAAQCVDDIDPQARMVNSVNTVKVDPKSGRLFGCSTDGYGLEMAAKEHFGFSAPGGRLAFIGGGGAVCAAAVHMALRGAEKIVLLNRTVDKIERIKTIIVGNAPSCRVICLSLKSDAPSIRRTLEDIPLVIQSTSLGLRPDDPLPVSSSLLPEECRVMDMIYGDTPLLKALRKEGCECADGLSMLLHQGARSFTIWTGREAPVETMRSALKKALKDRSG